MKSFYKRIVVLVSVFASVLFTGLVTLLFFPQPLFAHAFEYRSFTVYSGDPVPIEAVKVLDEAHRLISFSELHDKEFQHRLFLASGNPFNFVEDLLGKGPIARATAGNVIFKEPVDFEKNTVSGRSQEVNLTALLVHEMVHTLQAHRYGYAKFNPFRPPPYWKLEGYPEYIARQDMRLNDYSLKKEVIRFLNARDSSGSGWLEAVPGHAMPEVYFKGRIMIEYLMDVRCLSYDGILSDSRGEDEIFDELIKWAQVEVPN